MVFVFKNLFVHAINMRTLTPIILGISLILGSKLKICLCFTKVLYGLNGKIYNSLSSLPTNWTFVYGSLLFYLNGSLPRNDIVITNFERFALKELEFFTYPFEYDRLRPFLVDIGANNSFTLLNLYFNGTFAFRYKMLFFGHTVFCEKITWVEIYTWFMVPTSMLRFPAMELVHGDFIYVQCWSHPSEIQKPVLRCEDGLYKVFGKCSCSAGYQLAITEVGTGCYSK